jgi:hypothetical protein
VEEGKESCPERQTPSHAGLMPWSPEEEPSNPWTEEGLEVVRNPYSDEKEGDQQGVHSHCLAEKAVVPKEAHSRHSDAPAEA